jgi:hypothetical protein
MFWWAVKYRLFACTLSGCPIFYCLTWGAARLRRSLYPRLCAQPLRGYAPFGGFPGLSPQWLRLALAVGNFESGCHISLYRIAE